MADDDEVAKVDESPRRIDEGLGLVTDEKLNQELREESGGDGEGDDVVGEMAEELEAVVESEKSEIGGSEVRGVLEVEGAGIGESVDKDEVGVELDESGMAGVVELEGGEPQSEEKVRDVTEAEEHVLNETRIDQEDDNLGGNKSESVEDEDVKRAAIGGGTESQSEYNVDNLYPDFKTETAAVIEDYHINDAVEEKGEDFETAEQCVVMTACDDAGQTDESSKTVKQEDGEENVAGNSDLIGLVVEDYHMDDEVEEKREDFEKNPAVEQSVLMNACDEMEQIDESMKTVKEEDGEENDAVKSDFIGVEPTREHIDVPPTLYSEVPGFSTPESNPGSFTSRIRSPGVKTAKKARRKGKKVANPFTNEALMTIAETQKKFFDLHQKQMENDFKLQEKVFNLAKMEKETKIMQMNTDVMTPKSKRYFSKRKAAILREYEEDEANNDQDASGDYSDCCRPRF